MTLDLRHKEIDLFVSDVISCSTNQLSRWPYKTTTLIFPFYS